MSVVGRVVLMVMLLWAAPARGGDGLDVRAWLNRPGVRMLAVEFYATWCKPCMKSVPRWKALHEKYRDQGLRLIVVSTQDPNGMCVNPGWNPDDIVCDVDGTLAKAMKVGKALPAAFLWSWQGDLLIRRGHVDEVERAVKKAMAAMPRVALDPKIPPQVRPLLRTELNRTGKVDVLADKEERAALAKIRKESHRLKYDTAAACEIGHQLPPNSLLKAKFVKSGSRRLLVIQLFSAKKACMTAGASVNWNAKRPGISVAEAVTRLVGALKTNPEMPGMDKPGGDVAGGEKVEEVEVPTGEDVVIKLESDPPGAKVKYRGATICPKTPCPVEIPAGPVTLQFHLDEYEVKQVKITARRSMKPIKAVLKALFALLNITTTPPGIPAKLDGDEIGTTPITNKRLEPGRHKVDVGNETWANKWKEFSVGQGETKTLDFQLEARKGVLKIKARNEKDQPVSGKVYIGDKEVSLTGKPFAWPVGEVEVEVRTDKGIGKKKLTLAEGQTLTEIIKIDSSASGDMVLIPAGKFWMGCNERLDKKCDKDEKPYHEVYLDAYYIDKHEVTNGDYESCVRAGKCTRNHADDGKCYVYTGKNWKKGPPLQSSFRQANHPVVCVDWSQAKAYCEWKGGRLPTEAEWEKAARGTDGRVYPWGYEKATCSRAFMSDGGFGCGRGSTWPVCSKPAGNSPYGLCDMAGNVWEWVNDWYDSDYYKKSPARNPKGANSGGTRVYRGGSWLLKSRILRASNRLWYDPDGSVYDLGFRCVRSSRQ